MVRANNETGVKSTFTSKTLSLVLLEICLHITHIWLACDQAQLKLQECRNHATGRKKLNSQETCPNFQFQQEETSLLKISFPPIFVCVYLGAQLQCGAKDDVQPGDEEDVQHGHQNGDAKADHASLSNEGCGDMHQRTRRDVRGCAEGGLQ